ncbi:MAG: DUF732 domain-containing protein [Mycobacterium sp.]
MFSRLTVRTAASATIAAALGSALVFGSAVAGATPADDSFTEYVSKLGVPVDSPEQAVKLGHDICTLLTTNGASGPNPVPVVRGVVSTLTNQGLEKGQAVPLMRAAVTVYCPEFGSIIGR